jgi:hypothetical protein
MRGASRQCAGCRRYWWAVAAGGAQRARRRRRRRGLCPTRVRRTRVSSPLPLPGQCAPFTTFSLLTRQSGKWPSLRDEDDGEHEAGPAPLPRRRLEARALVSLAAVGRDRAEKGARRVRFIALGAGEGCIDVEEMDAAGEHDRDQHQCTPRPLPPLAHTLTMISDGHHPARTVCVLHPIPSSVRFARRRYP